MRRYLCLRRIANKIFPFEIIFFYNFIFYTKRYLCGKNFLLSLKRNEFSHRCHLGKLFQEEMRSVRDNPSYLSLKISLPLQQSFIISCLIQLSSHFIDIHQILRYNRIAAHLHGFVVGFDGFI